MLTKKAFLVLLALLSYSSALSESIDVSWIRHFPNPINLGWQYQVELDCNSNERSFLSSSEELKKALLNQLKTKNIEDRASSPYTLKVTITDHSCNANGLNDDFVSPLGLYGKETTSALVVVKVNFEIEEKSNNKIIHSEEIILLSKNEEEEGHFMWFIFEKEIKEVSLRNAWGKASKYIADKVEEIL